MKYFVAAMAITALVISMSMGAVKANPPTNPQDNRTTKGRTLDYLGGEYEKAAKKAEAAQRMFNEAQAEMLRLEGAISVMQVIVDEEQTSAPATMPALPDQRLQGRDPAISRNDRPTQ